MIHREQRKHNGRKILGKGWIIIERTWVRCLEGLKYYWRSCLVVVVGSTLVTIVGSPPSYGDEKPYFVTYDQYMEETGDFDIGIHSVRGRTPHGDLFLGSRMEWEYGIRAWWTTEFYLDGQWTQNQSTIFTGFRVENRFRPLPGNHRINVVLYVEYEDLNEADKTLQEVVGFDSKYDSDVPNDIARREHEREIETRLILGGELKGWNLAGNAIAERDLSHGPWEFGYAFGFSHRLGSNGALNALRAGIEFYGGLGDQNRFGVRDTSQYLGVCLAWKIAGGPMLRISPTFGLTSLSHDFLLRVGVSQEISHIDRRIRRLFR